jgi:hypothetical protein
LERVTLTEEVDVRVRTATVHLRSKRLILERVDVTTDGVPIGTDDLLVVRLTFRRPSWAPSSWGS